MIFLKSRASAGRSVSQTGTHIWMLEKMQVKGDGEEYDRWN